MSIEVSVCHRIGSNNNRLWLEMHSSRASKPLYALRAPRSLSGPLDERLSYVLAFERAKA